ncbi:MAG TPA: FG-GAP repeat protein [Nitrososphaeraceae archaeon]|nr:FG-GAP repeat protein [Nitrososphaeraceae archaeon]
MDPKINPQYKQNYPFRKKKSDFHFNAKLRDYFMLFSFFCIFLPTGMLLGLETNYVFGQIENNLINETDKNNSSISFSNFTSPSHSDRIPFVSNKSNENSSAPQANQSSIELSSDSSSQSGGRSSSKANGDFNGDGFDDLAIGVALEDVDIAGGSLLNAGAVNVIYGSSNGLNATSPIPNQFWTQDNVSGISEFRDRFGESLSSGDFNRDGFDDLAIGVTLEDVQTVHGGPTIEDAGAVNVIYGSSNGLNATSPIPNQFWTQNKVGGFPGTSEFFGTSLASGDFNGDALDDLAIGVPDEDVVRAGLTRDNAGAINVIYGSSNGLSATSTRPSQFWTQDTADVDDYSDEDDKFGEFLTSGDFNHDAIDDLAIGVPDEDFAPGPNAGSNLTNDGIMQVIYGSAEGLSATLVREDQRWSQSFTDIEDFAEQYDGFGSALATGDFNGDAIDDLAIGVSGESVNTSGGTIVRAGAVNVIHGSSMGLSATSPIPNQFWTQATAGVDELPDEGDLFGLSLASGDFNNDSMDDLVIGVPDESVNTGSHIIVHSYGAVNVIYGSSAGLSTDALSPGDGRAAQLWTQNSTNVDDVPEDEDFFGRYLKTGDFNGDAVDDLVIGAHGEGNYVSGVLVNDAGAINVIYGSVGIAIGSGGLSATVPLGGIGRDDQFWTQDTEDVEDHLEFNDYFGRPVA